MIKHYSQEDMVRYLTGAFSPEEVDALDTHVESCEECRKLLDAETEFEADLIVASRSSDESMTSGLTFDDMIKKATTETTNPVSKPVPASRFLSFPQTQRWLFAAAATLLLGVGLYLFHKPESQEFAQTPPQTQVPQPVLVQEQREKPKVAALRFKGKSIAIASEKSRLTIVSQTEKEAVAQLDTGSALFSVEPGQYTAFVVETPDARITVHGTIFDVWYSGGSTKVTVLEGKVAVEYHALKKEVSLQKNQSSKVDSGSVTVQPLQIKEAQDLAPFVKTLSQEEPSRISELAAITAVEPQAVVPSEPAIDWNAKVSDLFALSDKRDYGAALAGWQTIAKECPISRIVETARFESAMLELSKLNRREEGVRSLELYLKDFPSGAFEEEALVELVKATKSQPSSYANTSRLISRYPDHPYARRAAYENATLLREAGRYSEASDLYSRFFSSWPKDNRAEDALYWKSKTLLMHKDSSSSKASLLEYQQKYPEGRWIKDVRSLLTP